MISSILIGSGFVILYIVYKLEKNILSNHSINAASILVDNNIHNNYSTIETEFVCKNSLSVVIDSKTNKYKTVVYSKAIYTPLS